MPPQEVKEELKKFMKYLKYVFENYLGVVFQKFIPDFGNGKKCPELCLYYIGGEYQYFMCFVGGSYLRLWSEGGKTDFPMDRLKPHTKDILERLPKMVVNGVEVPRLLDRFDMGYLINGEFVILYVNEIEFVFFFYIEDYFFVVEDKLGD